MCTLCCIVETTKETDMNIKSIATLAAAIIASSAWAAAPADQKCGAGSCGKKESSAAGKDGAKDAQKDAACSKKEASCSKKDASCSKKEASCSKK